MIILYELVEFIKVIRIKVFALYAEVPFDRFCKELRFVGVCLGDFVVVAQCWIIALTLWLEKFLILRQYLLGSFSKLIELQIFSQLACVSTLSLSLTCFYNWLMCVVAAGSLFWECCLLSLSFSLISAIVSLEMGLFSDHSLLDFGMALSTAVLIAVTTKSAYLSWSLVEVSPEKSTEYEAAWSVDLNTSLLVWSNLYLVWLIDEFLSGVVSIETSMGRRSPLKLSPI